MSDTGSSCEPPIAMARRTDCFCCLQPASCVTKLGSRSRPDVLHVFGAPDRLAYWRAGARPDHSIQPVPEVTRGHSNCASLSRYDALC